MAYFDANATEPLRPTARAAVLAAMETPGNPSSVHAAGRAARRMLEEARTRLAACFGAAPAGVVFTSGGTEANALALHGLGAERVLGDAHRPQKDRGIGTRVFIDECFELQCAHTGIGEKFIERQ